MIDSLITSRTRIRLLKKFFLNSSTRAHLRGLESELGESTNGIRVELNRMEEASLLDSVREGNRKFYFANRKHPLFNEIHNIIIKETGIDRVVEKVVNRLGNVTSVYLTGDLARGIDTSTIEILLSGSNIDMEYLGRKATQAGIMVGRKVICSVMNEKETAEKLGCTEPSDILLIWSAKDLVND